MGPSQREATGASPHHGKLGTRNLQVNAAKTKYVHNQEGKYLGGDVEVEKDKNGSVTVLAYRNGRRGHADPS